MLAYKKNTKNILNKIISFLGVSLGVLLTLLLFANIVNTSMYYDSIWGYNFSVWQVPLFIILNIIIICLAVFSLYKQKNIYSILLFVACAISFRSGVMEILPDLQYIRNLEICDDFNYYKDGLKGIENKEECLKKQNAWNIDDKGCLYFFDKEDCYNLNNVYPIIKGNWEYPDICKK